MIYLAAPFFKPSQLETVQRIEQLLEDLGLKYFSPRQTGKILGAMSPEERKKNAKVVFDKNVQWISQCETMVAVIDDRDPGTIWEIGFAAHSRHMLGMPEIITYTDHDYGVNVMIRECVDAHCKGIERLRACLVSKDLSQFRDFDPEKVF